MRTLALFTLLLGLALPLAADNRACTSQLVTGGLCVDTSHRLLSYSIPNADPDGAGPKLGLATTLAEAICSPAIGNYQATLADGVPNPESCPQFADRWIKQEIFRKQILGRYQQYLEEQKKQQAIDADPIPEIP